MGDRKSVEIPDKLFFRIGEAGELVGVETHVLRYWETEFKMRPQRSGSGQRMYRRKDIEKFLRIRSLLHDKGFTIAGARKELQGKAAGAASAGIEAGRVREVLDRMSAIRQRIGVARERFSSSLKPESSSDH